jgi:pimeloyl-ACP methyl ester carboxylesterase
LARAVAAGVLVSAAACTNRPPPPPPPGSGPLPVIFVHGVLGSGNQYRTNAQRWAANGFPAEKVKAFNYNSQTVDASGLNALVDSVRRQFGVDRVNLVGHSLGTFVVNNYVTANAAKISRFVLVDGAGCPAGNSSCLAIRAAEMGQTHVEASTSAQSFARQYRFFTGQDPATTDVVPEATVRLGGNALDLATNAPAAGANGQVWTVNPDTGARQGGSPAATFTVGADGSWGPVSADGQASYEITLQRAGSKTAHYYFQPFLRSSYLITLTTSPPNSPNTTNTNSGPNHAAVVIQRQREWWRSHGAANDTLAVSTTLPGGGGQPLANVFQSVTGDVVGIHLFDDTATPRSSSLRLLPYYSTQAFQTGVDVYMPAATPPTGTITFLNAPRGDNNRLQQMSVANWASSTDTVLVEFRDFVQ